MTKHRDTTTLGQQTAANLRSFAIDTEDPHLTDEQRALYERVADLLDPPRKSLYDTAIDTFEANFQGESKTLGESLDATLDAIAASIQDLSRFHPYHQCECRDTIDQIAASLRERS